MCYNAPMKHGTVKNGRGSGWLPLDNAAKIYPPAMTEGWNALFRVSVTLDEPVDRQVLKRALLKTVARFPNFAMRLRRGFFWYYLDKLDGAPDIRDDVQNPCARMLFRENGGFAFRVRCFGRRIAVEIFHVITDGAGGLSFLKTLTAEYISIKYGVKVPREGDILDCDEPASAEELADGFLTHAGPKAVPEPPVRAYRLYGTPDRDFLHVTCGILDAAEISARAKAAGVTVTEYLTTVLLFAAADWKKARGGVLQARRPVKVTVPVNLRRLFGCRTLRNFANYANVGLDTRLGEYGFDEAVQIVHHQLKLETDPRRLAAKVASNVGIERNVFMRLVPLFIKDPIMSIAYRIEGDRKSTTCLSNLGLVKLPGEMEAHVERFDFMLGSLIENPVACAAIGYGGKLYVNFTRTIRESFLERAFFTRLVKMGIKVFIESNEDR
ncbi:MAG: hypothetical protein J5586_00485 [Clostridia bacterium]|nr:hypothetical protein [Clostridia bacterium]